MQETWVQSLGWEDPLEKGKANHSSILAWRIPWTCIVHGVTKSQTQLSSFHFHFFFLQPLLNTHTQPHILRHTHTHTHNGTQIYIQKYTCIQTYILPCTIYLDSAQRHKLSATSKSIWNSAREDTEPSGQPNDIEEKKIYLLCAMASKLKNFLIAFRILWALALCLPPIYSSNLKAISSVHTSDYMGSWWKKVPKIHYST